MGDRLNDTDPQSPRALVSRTDPGLGTSPVVLPPRPQPPVAARTATPPLPPPPAPAPTPTPSGTASIEELLDGITGPRPPPSRREGPDADRAYAAARPAPASRPMPPPEPLVVSPDPPLYSGAGRESRDREEETSPRRPDPASTRPVVRRAAEERTVYTGRRALVRNLAVAVASSLVVALTMMTLMRWKESQHPRRASAVVVLPAVPDTDTPASPVPAPEVAAPVAATEPAVAVPRSVSAIVPGPSATAAASVTKPPVSTGRRAKGDARSVAPPASSLDDLNREIRH